MSSYNLAGEMHRLVTLIAFVCLFTVMCHFKCFLNCLHKRKKSHDGYICRPFLHRVSSNHQPDKRQSHIGRICSTVRFQMCPQIECMGRGIVTFFTVCFQMCPQIACIRGCIVTLVASIRLFSSVCFQMCSQMACLGGCIVTLVAFVWLFSSVRFQMCP